MLDLLLCCYFVMSADKVFLLQASGEAFIGCTTSGPLANICQKVPYISQGSVATCIMCGRIFDNSCITDLMLSLIVHLAKLWASEHRGI